MPDNVTLPGTGESVSTEEVTNLNGGVVAAQQLQRVAPAFITADGVAVDGAQALTDTQLRAAAVPVSGSVGVTSMPTISGVSLDDVEALLLRILQALNYPVFIEPHTGRIRAVVDGGTLGIPITSQDFLSKQDQGQVFLPELTRQAWAQNIGARITS